MTRDLRTYTLEEAQALIQEIVACTLRQKISYHGQASLVLTGGRSVRSFLPGLAALELSWKEVRVTLSDERCVLTHSALSNASQLRELFLNHMVCPPAFFSPLMLSCPENRKLADALLPFSLTLLSMGEDGHLASLFEGQQAGVKSGDLFQNASYKGVKRISWTQEALLTSEKIIILVCGTKRINFLQNLSHDHFLSSLYRKSLVLPIVC